MPAVATLKWSGTLVGKSTDGKRAAKIWDVIDAEDGDAALAADGIAVINQPYKTNDRRRCRTVDARQVSVGVWEVTAMFGIPPRGEWDEPNDDPLNEPPTIHWQSVVMTVPFDRDIEGNPIVNAAGDAFSNPPTRTFVHKTLKITKNRPSYAYQTLKQYENTVNDGAVTVSGTSVVFDDETMKCVTIEPAGPYLSTATVIPVTATFEIFELNDDIATAKPHQLRILNQGLNGWYGDGKHGQISSDTAPVSTDKLLDANGKPLNTAFKIWDGASGQPPTANPEPVTWCDFESTDSAVYMVFKRYKKTNFNALFAALGV